MDYRYLITYFNEPIAIADTHIQALTAIRDDIRLHKTNRQDYDYVALRYYHENKNENPEDTYYKTLMNQPYSSELMNQPYSSELMCSEE